VASPLQPNVLAGVSDAELSDEENSADAGDFMHGGEINNGAILRIGRHRLRYDHARSVDTRRHPAIAATERHRQVVQAWEALFAEQDDDERNVAARRGR
jgi:hypothetical protein